MRVSLRNVTPALYISVPFLVSESPPPVPISSVAAFRFGHASSIGRFFAQLDGSFWNKKEPRRAAALWSPVLNLRSISSPFSRTPPLPARLDRRDVWSV